MENPATWGPAEKIVNQALDAFYENVRKPADERVIGFSLARSITNALRVAGLLKEEQ